MSQPSSNTRRRRRCPKVPAPARDFETVPQGYKRAAGRKRRFYVDEPRNDLSETPLKKAKVVSKKECKNKIGQGKKRRLNGGEPSNDSLETPIKKIKVIKKISEKNESQSVPDSNNKLENPKNTVQVKRRRRHRRKQKEPKLMQILRNLTRKDRFLRKYEQQDLIGQGSFGKVYAGVRTDDGLPVAIKYIPVQSVPHNVQVKNDQIVPAEVYFLKKLKHQNIIKLLSHYEFENHHVLVMERPSDGINLYDYIGKRGGELSEQEVKKIARQLIPAVMYLEEMGVIHNDLKTENILLDEGVGRVKIIDFGLACRLSCDPIDQFIGTRTHCPPEYAVEFEYFGQEATVWSLGCVMYDLLTGEIPYQDDQDACWSPLMLPEYLSQGASDFVCRMLQKDRQNRATLEELLEHHWLQDD